MMIQRFQELLLLPLENKTNKLGVCFLILGAMSVGGCALNKPALQSAASENKPAPVFEPSPALLASPADTLEAVASVDFEAIEHEVTFVASEERQTADEWIATAAPLASIAMDDNPPAADIAPTDIESLDVVKPNLWHRFHQGLTWSHASNARIQVEKKWYAKNTKYIERVINRGAPYLFHIVDQLERNDMPVELALLPIVESAYQPFAFSHGRATGIWQFIPSTGRLYGLKQNWWYDGRRDIVASTDAALTFLKRLEGDFDGDWLHALAAYNAGPGRVSRAIKRNAKKGKSTSYWDLTLPRETHHYVPKLLALLEIMRDPQAHGFELPPVDDEPQFEVVDIRKQLDLSRAAEMADISVEQMYLYNPGFNRWATDPDGPHRLVIPKDNADRFKTELAQLPDSERITWTRHKIKPGETLSTIARKYKTSVSHLKKVNGLNRNLIRAGKNLMIPGPGASDSTYVYSASQRLRTAQSKGKGEKHIHRVRSGDTLWGLSNKYNASVRKIAKWNNMGTRSPLRIGQKLVIWRPSSKKSTTSSLPTTVNASFSPAIQTIRYTVKRGDSLDRIAQRFNIRVADLFRWNSGLKNAKYIQPGQKIRVKLDVRQQSG